MRILDNTDQKILQLLVNNARVNTSEIAEKVKLSPSTASDRIKKMEANGTILGYTAILSSAKLGKGVTALMSVAIEHPKYNDGFIKAVLANPDIIECFYLAGEFDFYLKIITDNIDKLECNLNAIKSIPGVSKTKTNIVLSTPKNKHDFLNPTDN